jgi:RNA polymerase sigma-70 factor (ECF subfamily)
VAKDNEFGDPKVQPFPPLRKAHHLGTLIPSSAGGAQPAPGGYLRKVNTYIRAISNECVRPDISVVPATHSAIASEELRIRFEKEVTPFVPTLYRVAKHFTKNTADAEDLLQETMIRAYSGFVDKQTETPSKAWFIRIMRNIWIDDYRRMQRRPIECLIPDMGEWEWSTSYRRALEARNTVEAQLIGTVVETDVRNAFQSLSDELRRALYYAYVEGFPYKDIARLEAIPLGTVMSRLYRARRQLRKSLAQHSPSAYCEPHSGDADVA